MGLFSKKEVVHTDVLQEWRKLKLGDFNLFDKVILVSHGDDRFSRYLGKEAICVGCYEYYDIEKEYKIMFPDGVNIQDATDIKKSYGEFQEEFEALEASQQKLKEVELLKAKLLETEKEAYELYEKGKKVVEKNLSTLGIGTS